MIFIFITKHLKGNQFIWIPCEDSEYEKCTTWNGETYGDTLYLGLYNNEGTKVNKYNGYYVARYEAGLDKRIIENIYNNNVTDGKYDFSKIKIKNEEVITIPQSKAGQIPWNNINFYNSTENAKNMYTDIEKYGVESALITGAQWDVMLKKMIQYTDLEETDMTNSSKWGNYKNTSISYTGRSLENIFGEFGGDKTSQTIEDKENLLTTGASKETQIYHISDVAGNLGEWTCEYDLNVNKFFQRGGCYAADTSFSGCYRSAIGAGASSIVYRLPRNTLY